MGPKASKANAHEYGKFVEEQKHACDKNFWQATKLQHLTVIMTSDRMRAFAWYIVNVADQPDNPIMKIHNANCDDATHSAVQIDFNCHNCHEKFPVTYEFGSGVHENPGVYTQILKCEESTEDNFPYSRIQEVLDLLNWTGHYDMFIRNCKHWASQFYTRLVFYDLIELDIGKMLELLKPPSTPANTDNDTDLKTLIEKFGEIIVRLVQIVEDEFTYREHGARFFVWLVDDLINNFKFFSSKISQIPQEYKTKLVFKFLRFSTQFAYDLFLINTKIEAIQTLFKCQGEEDFRGTYQVQRDVSDSPGGYGFRETFQTTKYLIDIYGKEEKPKEDEGFISWLSKKLTFTPDLSYHEPKLPKEEKIEKIKEFFGPSSFVSPLKNYQKKFEGFVRDEIKYFGIVLSPEMQIELEKIFAYDFSCDLRKELNNFGFKWDSLEIDEKGGKMTVDCLETAKLMLNLREYFKTKDVVDLKGKKYFYF